MEELFKSEIKSLVIGLKTIDYGDIYWINVVKAIIILLKYKDLISYSEMVHIVDNLRIEIVSMGLNNIYEDFTDEILSILIQYSSGDIDFNKSNLDDYKNSKAFKKYFDMLESR